MKRISGKGEIRRVLFGNLKQYGWVPTGTKCTRTSNGVVRTVTLRIDPVGSIDVGVWVDVLDLPLAAQEGRLLHGHIGASIWPSDRLKAADFELASVLAGPDQLSGWAERMTTEGVLPFFSYFDSPISCMSSVRELWTQLSLAVSPGYQQYIGLERPASWEFGAAYSQNPDLTLKDPNQQSDQ